jgi:hypothetical protein
MDDEHANYDDDAPSEAFIARWFCFVALLVVVGAVVL